MTSLPQPLLYAELLSVGTELLLGEILDSNAAFLGRELTARGVMVQRRQTVGDNLGRIVAAMQEALGRADVLIVGGGLGPTDDDMTREAIAQLAGQTPYEDPQILAWLRGLFESRGREMPAINRKQAWLIPAAVSLPNPNGTAPGWLVTLSTGPLAGKRIAALPGPPREMQPMFLKELLPRLNLPTHAFYAVTLHTTGIGEGSVAEQLGAALTQAGNPSVATYARASGTDIRVAASAATAEEAQQLAQPVLQAVRAQFEHFIWAQTLHGEEQPTLAQVACTALGQHTVAVTEAGSGGALALHLAGQSAVRGVAVSEDHAALLTLGLTPVTLHAHGVTSAEAAAELAQAASTRWGADYGLSVVVNLAGGQGHAALVGAGQTHTAAFNWPGNAAQVRERAAITALALLWRGLSGV